MTGPAPSARDRILHVARTAYYEEGIGAVSADRLIARAEVSKVTFYRHFPTKADLVAAYLEAEAEAEAHIIAAKSDELNDPCAVLRWYARRVAEVSCGTGFRGCPFVNARAELAVDDHPAWAIITAHYEGLVARTRTLLEEVGHDDAGAKAQALVLLRDGAMVGRRSGMTPAQMERVLLEAGRTILGA